MTDKLSPCPFCGGAPLIVQSRHANKLWAVHCKNCDAGPSASLGRDEAIETWNSRSPSPQNHVERLALVRQSASLMPDKVQSGSDLEPGGSTSTQNHAVALAKINDIRNSIIGFQTINWSEHIYPLVASLEEAGFEGAEYPTARANVGTMLDRTLAAEDAVEALQGLIKEALSVLDGYADPTAYTDNYGEMLPADAEVHDGVLARDTAAKIRAALATTEGQP